MKVQKNSGIIVTFDRNKLRQSLLKSGAGKKAVESVLQNIEHELYDGIPTKKIYKLASQLLKKVAASHAARYNLRNALLLLGPAGFFFEKFIARLYEKEGYKTLINLNLKGHCVSHEVDVVAQKELRNTMIECKFHNSSTNNSDVKTPMYILSRFNDLKVNRHKLFKENEKIDRCCIATNNRFTSDALTFALCSGLDLLSWDYPFNDNLKIKIDENALYPVTCLTTLSAVEKEKLLILDVILASELLQYSEKLTDIGISFNRQKNILKEASELCKN